MSRLSTYWCATLLIALANALLHSLGAQQIRPAAVAHGSDSTISDTARQVTANVAFAPGSRSRHVVNGAAGGAVVGGVYGLIVDQRDKSGEGFIAPIMIGAGAIAGMLIGMVVGLLWPIR